MYSRVPTAFCKDVLLVRLVCLLLTRGLGTKQSVDSLPSQGEVSSTPKISELDGTTNAADTSEMFAASNESANVEKPITEINSVPVAVPGTTF
jgi:hypothetical protein